MATQLGNQQNEHYEPVCMMDHWPTDPERLQDFVIELQNMRAGGFTVNDLPEDIMELHGDTLNGLNMVSMEKRGRPLETYTTKVYRLDDMIDLVEEIQRESEEKEREMGVESAHEN